jgi:hypothetical protein
MKTTAVYNRVSTDNQEVEGTSLQTQPGVSLFDVLLETAREFLVRKKELDSSNTKSLGE